MIPFLIVSYIIISLIILFSPKRLTKQEIYIAWIFVALTTLISDITFGVIWDKYDLMNKQGPQPIDLFVEITLPSLFGILYLNFMPKRTRKFLLYFVFWVVFSVLYEQISRYFGYVHYKGWKVWYSILFYILACAFMRLHYLFIRRAINKE